MRKKEKALKMLQTFEEQGELRTYQAPWKGQLLLACAKCQKKIRHAEARHPLAKIKRIVKQCVRQDDDHFRMQVINTPCLKLCPKGGVAACNQEQLGRAECSILRTLSDVGTLYARSKASWQAALPS